jgi:ATP adenylyltransferase
MRTLWAPWRMSYILQEKKRNCFFCQGLLERKDEENLILHRGKLAFVVMNRFPYNNGHLMVVPRRHLQHLEELSPREGLELFDLLQVSLRVLGASLNPQGFNVGLNLGKAAGAGEQHVHFHIVPRWVGDSNYMPVLGETKVIPEYLSETYRKLRLTFDRVTVRKKDRKGGRQR